MNNEKQPFTRNAFFSGYSYNATSCDNKEMKLNQPKIHIHKIYKQ